MSASNLWIETYGYSCKWARSYMHVGQSESDNGIFMPEITRNEGEERGQAARFQPPRPRGPRKESSLKYSNTLHREHQSVLIIALRSCLLPPPPLLPPNLCLRSFFLPSLYLPSHRAPSFPFPSSPLPNAFLSAPRWNRKCWFNNSQSEFCIHAASSAAQFLSVRQAKWSTTCCGRCPWILILILPLVLFKTSIYLHPMIWGRGQKWRSRAHTSFFIFGICKCFCACVLSIYNIPTSLAGKKGLFFSYMMPHLFFCVFCDCRWSRSTLRSLTWR